MVISDRRWWRNWGKVHLCTAYCQNKMIINLLNHCVLPFVFRKGNNKIFSYQFRASFWINLLDTRDRQKPYSLLLWTMVGGRVGYKVWQKFCCVWLQLVCHECLGQSGIWRSFDGELCLSSARHPPPTNSPTMYSRMVHKDPKINNKKSLGKNCKLWDHFPFITFM